jgi:hypothetical protein
VPTSVPQSVETPTETTPVQAMPIPAVIGIAAAGIGLLRGNRGRHG